MVGSSPNCPVYPSDIRLAIKLALPVIFLQKRSFQKDASRWIKGIQPAPVIHGKENIPQHSPFLLVINHYYRLRYKAWWSALASSAVIPSEIHWIISAAWTYPDHPMGRYLELLSRFVIRRIAQVYTFSLMPPMPPRPWEVASRAQAVRKILEYVHKNPMAVIGLAPEGGDSPSGVVEKPASGVGRFILHLTKSGLAVYPLGIYEAEGALHLNFGKTFHLNDPITKAPEARDRWCSQVVMQTIAELLPAHLRGAFSDIIPVVVP